MTDESKIQTLLEWARSHGTVIDPSIQFKSTANRGISVFANKSIVEPSTKPQIKIPLSIIIKSDLAEGYFGEEFVSKGDNVNSALKLLVARMKFESSSTGVNNVGLEAKFAPFIDLLPVGRETGSVFYWTSEELSSLGRTNLAGSLSLKTRALLDEWYSTVRNLEESPQLVEDLKLYKEFDELDHDSSLSKLLDVTSWTSFGAYLWASIIFTSRAFPHEIIDSNCKPGQAILLPVVDLLNHDNSSNVEWSFEQQQDENNSFFTLLNKDLHTEGAEIFNNYGAKSNEELLLGYGFAIENNSSDTIALKVKLPAQEVKEAETFGFKVPRIDEYTHFAFLSKQEAERANTPYDENEGMLFYINYQNLIPDNLLRLFQFKASQDTTETGPTLRNKLNGLQILRSALESKSSLLKAHEDVSSIERTILQNATYYKDGQKALYKASLKKIKHEEKELLRDYKSNVTTLQKIYKRDDALQDILSFALDFDSYAQLEQFGVQDILIIWIILHAEGLAGEYQAPEYLIETYKANLEALKNEEVASELFEDFIQDLGPKIFEKEIGQFLKPKNIAAAGSALNQNAYQRVSDDLLILVEPVEL